MPHRRHLEGQELCHVTSPNVPTPDDKESKKQEQSKTSKNIKIEISIKKT